MAPDRPAPEASAALPASAAGLLHPGGSDSSDAPTRSIEALSDSSSNPIEAAPPPLRPDLGPAYTVVRLLGRGGMGAVWLARWRSADIERDVAVKLLLSGHESADDARRFQRERRILARLQHPAIARLLDVGRAADGRLFLCMEFIDGRTLSEHVRAERLDIPARLRLIAAIADAVSYAHQKLIIHRDLKPQNVMVDAAGQPQLLDFGIARLLEDSTDERLTRTGGGPLSLAYAAPEQLRGEEVGVPADIYSLAVMTYELLCGQRPFPRIGGLERILREIESERLRTCSGAAARNDYDVELAPPLPARKLARALRGDLDIILMRALAPQPERRYASVAEFSDDLRRYLAGEPVRARRDSSLYRLRKFAQRHWPSLTVGAAAVAALAIGLLVARSEAERANLARDRALAARDFLLSVVQSANPYQAPNPTRRIDTLFEAAAHTLAGRFPNDPEMEAQLLQQFGRSLMVLERYEAAGTALERAEALLAGRVPDTHPVLVETRGRLTDLYRQRRQFERARRLAHRQLQQCATAEPPPPLACLAIRNDAIEVAVFSGEASAALEQIAQAQSFAHANDLDADYEAVFIDYLRGIVLRDLGRSPESAQAFIRLAERTLAAVPAQHPGLLTDLLWFAWTLYDLGELKLATQLSDYAMAGRQQLYGENSRYIYELRQQRGILAFAAGDHDRARREFRALLDGVPNEPALVQYRESANAWLALVDREHAGSLDLAALDAARAEIVGEVTPRLAELRLLLAAVALKRGAPDQAEAFLAAANQTQGTQTRPYLKPLALALEANLREAQSRPTDASALRAAAVQLLQRQGRRLFDPVAERWIGAEPAGSASLTESLQALAQRISSARWAALTGAR